MDPQTLLNMLFGITTAMAGWFARAMWAAVDELKADITKLREELPKTYVPKDDFKEGVKEIKDMLGHIFAKLDEKADK